MHSNTQSADLCDGRGSLPVLVDIEDSLPNLPPIYNIKHKRENHYYSKLLPGERNDQGKRGLKLKL